MSEKPMKSMKRLCCLVPLLFAGCNLFALQEELVVFDQLIDLRGTIRGESINEHPMILVVYERRDDGPKVVAYAIRYVPGPFRFRRLPGRCYLAGFEDVNEDFVYQPGEPAGYYGNPTPVETRAGEQVDDLDITLRPGDKLTLDLPIDLSGPDGKADLELTDAAIGEVVGLDDDRFSARYGPMGLWEPIRQLREAGAGIYFLEPYDPDRIPVLFVHGAGGYPQAWEYLIDKMDRTKFQPWVYQYPSGSRLDSISEWLTGAMTELHVKHKFDHFCVVGHSMGGLVTRPMVNYVAEHDTGEHLKLYVTISTPWGGHNAASWGVNYSPAVVPSWVDMVPGSPFQESILNTELPPWLKNYLFFSYGGSASMIAEGKDDGTVSLKSQLHPKAQIAATKLYGFNEDHVSILRSREVSNRLNELLQDAFERSR